MRRQRAINDHIETILEDEPMGFMDELKKLTHPYSEPEEDDYDDYDDEPLDNDPAPAPQSSRRSYSCLLYTSPSPRDTR